MMQHTAKYLYPLVLGISVVFWKQRKKPLVVPNFEPQFLSLDESAKSRFSRRYHYKKLKEELLEYEEAVLDLNTVFKLILKGSRLCQFIPVVKLGTDKEILQLENDIRELKLDSEWSNTLKFNTSPHCQEENLSCENGRLMTPIIRIQRLLTVLLQKLDGNFGQLLIDQGFLSILFDIYKKFSNQEPRISNLVLKLLSNIAMQNDQCAAAIVRTEWLHMLSALMSVGTLEETLLIEKICVNAINSFKGNGTHLGSNIYQLYSSDREPTMDIIFVHGLKGSVFRTWREKDDLSKLNRTRCWPRDWLSKDLNFPVRILAIDYPSSLIHFTGAVDTLDLRSQRFCVQLRDADVGSRPVVFICHSMGGLLVKNLLLNDKNLLRRTVGILFFATPHLGSPLAKYAYMALRPTNDVTMLRYNSLVNKKLHEEFMLISDRVPVVVSVLETEEAPLIFGTKSVMVPWESAILDFGAVYHVKDFHHNVCKPRDRTDNKYTIVLQFIADALNQIKRCQQKMTFGLRLSYRV
uniref:GPI inositol-deacylase n=1 Tax=Syphacia muris TaxID=451379 RepID=A0A0N5AVP3_9BILA